MPWFASVGGNFKTIGDAVEYFGWGKRVCASEYEQRPCFASVVGIYWIQPSQRSAWCISKAGFAESAPKILEGFGEVTPCRGIHSPMGQFSKIALLRDMDNT